MRAAGLAVLLGVATTLSAIAPADDPATGAAPGARPGAVAPLAAADGGVASVIGSAPAAQPVRATTPAAVTAPVTPGVARPAIRTMSMDEPIQGGLTAHQAQAASARVLNAHDDVATAPATATWTPAMGQTALARARSWLGMPYAWAGGTASGPTAGRCDAGSGADLDCHIVGFDCSGLSMYAWGAYTVLPHYAETQLQAGEFHPSVKQLRAGDLVFFAGYLAGGVGHVAVYEGDGMVIEAPQSGDVVRRSKLSELMANDGAYRGAVRPMTTATPVLAADTAAVPARGGTVTLHGKHLSKVTSLRVGTATIDTFAQQSDTAIVFRAPRSPVSRTIRVTATTAWDATSEPVTLHYAKPAGSAPAPSKTSAPVTAPTSPKTTTPPPRVKPTPKPTPTPAPTSSAPTTTAPSTTAPTSAPSTGTTSQASTATSPPATP